MLGQQLARLDGWFDEARKQFGGLATFETRMHVHDSTENWIVAIPTIAEPMTRRSKRTNPHVGTAFL